MKTKTSGCLSGSAEELADLKAAYASHDGDMERVIVELRCCTVEDLERHCHTVQSLINTRQLTHRKNFTRTAAIVRRRAAAQKLPVLSSLNLLSFGVIPYPVTQLAP